MNISLQHKDTYVPVKSSNFTPGYMARRTDSSTLKSSLYIMLIAALFAIAER